jgi:acyl-CoA thioesterase-1
MIAASRLTVAGSGNKFPASMNKLLLTFALFFALAAEATNPKTLLVLGDSIAAGYGLDREEAFPALIEEKIKEAGLNYRVINAGESGDTTAGGLRRISWHLRQPIDVVLLELGGNDGLRGIAPEETEKNLQGIIDKVRAKYPEAKIVIAGMEMPKNMGEEYVSKFREVFPRIAKENSAALVPFLLEGIAGKAEFNQPDRIHPTAEGHRIVANNVWKVLKPVLERSTQQATRP